MTTVAACFRLVSWKILLLSCAIALGEAFILRQQCPVSRFPLFITNARDLPNNRLRPVLERIPTPTSHPHAPTRTSTLAKWRLFAKANDDARSAAASLKFKNFDMMLDAFRNESVLVYFTSSSCGPCRLQTKELSTVKHLLGNNALPVLAIDTERFPHVGSRYHIGKLPCLLLMKDGQVLSRLEGLTRAETLVEQFHSNLNLRL